VSIVGRVASVGRIACPAGGLSIGALLVSVAIVAVPGNVSSQSPQNPSAPRSSDTRTAELLRPTVPRPTATPQTDAADKAKGDALVGFELANAELIHVRVRGQAEFSGDYRINPDMTISIPRLGRVRVGSMTAQDLERHLGDRLSSALRQDVSVAVEIVRFRPFFMTGQVTTPGSIEWRPSLTLIQAISLSGGVARPTSAADLDTPERRLLLEQARVRHSFAVAQLARVSAEKKRRESVEVEQLLNSFVAKALPESRDALEAFLTRQNQLLDEQRAAHESRVAGLVRERDAVLHELEAARSQADEVKLQVELTESHMEGIESLKSQQLLTNTRYLEHRRALADIRVRYSEAIQLVQRARTRYNSAEREIQTVQSQRESLLNERMEGLEREIAELELTLGGPTGLLEASNGSLSPALSYHIARRTSAGVQTLVANLFTEIYPGDVVIVSSKRRAGNTAGMETTTVSSTQTPLEETQRIMEGAVSPSTTASAPSASPSGANRRAASHRQAWPSQASRSSSGVMPFSGR
jgi:protein involved in polysaccharide export with SLBB domain